MSHLRGIRAQRRTVARNGAELNFGPWPMPGDAPDFQDTDQVDSYHGDAYHQMPPIQDHPRGTRPPKSDAQQENDPWHS